MTERSRTMAKKKRRKNRSRVGKVIYWICLALYAAVLIFLAVYVLRDWNKYLSVYDSSQPNSVIENYISNLNGPQWEEKIAEAVRSVPHPFQSDEECIEIVKSRVGEDINYSRAPSGGINGNKYNIKCGDNFVGSVVLVQDTSKVSQIDIGLFDRVFDKESLCPWYVQSDEFDISGFLFRSSASATVPSTYSISLNGVPVGPEYITETDIKYDILEPYYEEYEGLPTKVTYTVSDLIFGELEPVIFDESGAEYTPDPEAGDVQYMEPCSDEEISELYDFGMTFMEPYLKFFGTSNVDYNAGELRKYIITGSALDTRMQEFIYAAAPYLHFYSLAVQSQSFDGAFSLGGGFYVIKMTANATAYGEYKTVNQESQYTIVVCRTENGFKAISVE